MSERKAVTSENSEDLKRYIVRKNLHVLDLMKKSEELLDSISFDLDSLHSHITEMSEICADLEQILNRDHDHDLIIKAKSKCDSLCDDLNLLSTYLAVIKNSKHDKLLECLRPETLNEKDIECP